MPNKPCPFCSNELTKYPDYLYCFKCSKQFKKGLFGKLKEVEPTLQQDQEKALQQ